MLSVETFFYLSRKGGTKTVATPGELLKTARKQPKRPLAKQLQTQLRKRTYNAGDGTTTTRGRHIERMIVDLISNGETTFLDGRTMRITGDKEWLEAVKFLHTHIDGNANADQNSNNLNVNVFKVYAGIDMDKV